MYYISCVGALLIILSVRANQVYTDIFLKEQF